MTFKEWREWYKELPWTVKWFVILVLLRPIIDNFYKLKEVSPFLSPLNIVGVLTPFLIYFSIASGSMPKKNKSKVVNLFFTFGVIVVFNWILLDILYPTITIIGFSIKSITPILLFFYLLYVIRSLRDLEGVMTSFLYSGIYLLILMLYEFIFGSISGGHLTEGRGGGERLGGFYNDMMNYAIYIVGTLLIGGYYFLKNVYAKKKSGRYVLKFAIMMAISLMGLIGIKHVSTWAVCIALFTLIGIFNFRNFQGFFVILFLSIIIFAIFGKSIYESQIEPLVNKEINVANGDSQIEGGLNGRVGRWERYFDVWFNDIPIYSKLIGVPTSGSRLAPVMCGGGMHADYVRLLFTTGIIGLFIYLAFMAMVLYRGMAFKIPERFLIFGSVIAMMLHSVSTVPLAYSAYNYILFSIMSYSMLPLKNAYRSISWNNSRKNSKPQMRVNTEPALPTVANL
ncbi:MAG: hypothetical protein ABI763_11540 [Bacteroidota bacterium]